MNGYTIVPFCGYDIAELWAVENLKAVKPSVIGCDEPVDLTEEILRAAREIEFPLDALQSMTSFVHLATDVNDGTYNVSECNFDTLEAMMIKYSKQNDVGELAVWSRSAVMLLMIRAMEFCYYNNCDYFDFYIFGYQSPSSEESVEIFALFEGIKPTQLGLELLEPGAELGSIIV